MTRLRKLRIHLSSVFFVVAALPSLMASAGQSPSTAPAQKATDPRTVDGVAMIRRLASEKMLRLSTEGAQSPNRFQFVIRLSSEPNQAESSYAEYVVVRDGDRTAVLLRTLDGLPYCYITEGLMVMIDREVPGGIVVTSTGAPSVLYRLAEEPGKLEFWISHVRKATKGTIDVSVGPILQSLADKVRQATYERSSGTLIVRTDQSVVMLAMRAIERPGQFGLRAFITRTTGAQTLALLDPETDTPPVFEVGRITKESIAALGLPIREIASGDGSNVALAIPASFGADRKERDAATKLQTLFDASGSPHSTPARH